MNCAQISIQEYILTKSYTPINKISTDVDNSCTQIISDKSKNRTREEIVAMTLLQESNEDVESDYMNINNPKLFQCKCTQSPCECHLNKMGTSSMDNVSSKDLDSNFDDSRNKDNFTSITLADYFDALTKKPNPPRGTSYNILPREIISHYQMSRNKSHLLTSSVSTSPKQQFDANHNNEPVNDQINNNNRISNYSSSTSNNDSNEPSFPVDYFNYLKKRREFLTDRLLSRYTELIKLLNEELELTGYPPANYLQHTHAYYEALEAFKKVHGDDLSDQIYEMITNNDSGLQLENKGRHAKSINFIPMRGSRLQETSFMLSPRIMRRASIKLSSSVNCLLKTSHSSLFIEDVCNQHHGQSMHCDEDNSSQILEDPNNSIHFIKDNHNDTTNSIAPTKKLTKESSIMQKLNKSIPLAFKSHLTSNLVKSDCDIRTSASSPSLCDSGIFLRQTIETTTTKTTVETATSAQFPSSPSSSVSAVLTYTTQPLSSQSNKIIPIINPKEEICNPYNFKDIQQAISWLEVELNAVKNIMLANMKCADENKKNRASRKAYKLAAKRNQETITNLENQIHGLQMYTQKREILKSSKFENTSICNSDHYSTNQSLLKVSSSSLSSPLSSCSPSSSLLSRERRSIDQSTNEIPSKINILKKYDEKVNHSSITHSSVKDLLFMQKDVNNVKILRPVISYHINQRNLPQTSLQHTQLNNTKTPNLNFEALKLSSPSVSSKFRQGNKIQDNSTKAQQAIVPLKETTLTTDFDNGESDNNYENLSEYEHQRDNNYTATTKSSSSPVPSSLLDTEESQSYNTAISTATRSFSDMGTQTINYDIFDSYNKNDDNNNIGLDASPNSKLLLNGNYTEDSYRCSDQSSEMNSYHDSPLYHQLSSDSSHKLKSNFHQHQELSFNTKKLFLNENKCQPAPKQLNERQNSLLHLTKSYRSPTLSSFSSWSSTHSLCSVNLNGQRESVENTSSDTMPVNKVLQSSHSTHNIQSTPKNTLVDVELNNHTSNHQIQSNGIKVPTNQTNYYLPIHQLNKNINSNNNNTSLHYLSSEQVQSPILVNKTSKTCYYSPVSQNRSGQSIQKVIDYRSTLYPGLKRQNKGLHATLSTVNLYQTPTDSPNHRRSGNHSTRIIEQAKL
ncbi:unnamed protein product [Schistosoma rodhaini]|uniref:Uncharacterized protein n=3 Tax=Schistosoma rodhaini TaxID=6188 RepID=A0AA85G2T6_9TREM|nr:unnamed protein product [Schistosoma rodhaini]CAH8597036.1 unnamed protein product [Schistosoma rodhaini]